MSTQSITRILWGFTILAALAASSAHGDERADLLRRAKRLEKRAGQLLDAGKKDDAVELIMEAAELRQKARTLRAKIDVAPKPTDKASPRAIDDAASKAKREARENARNMERAKAKNTQPEREGRSPESAMRARLGEAMKRLDRAVAANQPQQAAAAAKQVRAFLGAWQKRLQQREQTLKKKYAKVKDSPEGLARRIAKLERDVKQLKKLLQAG